MTYSGSWGQEPGDVKNLRGGKLNINTASREELELIETFDAERVTEIIRYREEHGGFKSVDELLAVPKIRPDDLPKDVKDQLAA